MWKYLTRLSIATSIALPIQWWLDCHDAAAQAENSRPIAVIEYNNSGVRKMGSGDFSGAIMEFDKAIKGDPAYSLAFFNRALAKNSQSYRGDALDDLDEAIRLTPNRAHYHFERARLRQSFTDINGALSDFTKAIEFAPSTFSTRTVPADYYYRRGSLRSKIGKHEDAVADFNEAIKLNSSDPRYFHARGLEKEVLHDCGAKADFEQESSIQSPKTQAPIKED